MSPSSGVRTRITTRWLQGEVDRGTIEEYVELEKEIASHEAQRWGIVIIIIIAIIVIIIMIAAPH